MDWIWAAAETYATTEAMQDPINPVCQAEGWIYVSTVTQAAVVGFSTPCAMAGTPMPFFFFFFDWSIGDLQCGGKHSDSVLHTYTYVCKSIYIYVKKYVYFFFFQSFPL